MGKIIATQYISLDGVIEDPVGMENSGLGNWIGPYARGPAGDAFKDGELQGAASVRDVKSSIEGNILIYSSASLCHALIAVGLIDEIALMVYPIVLGRGVRLFPECVRSRSRPGRWATASRS